jgi:hypothetical protein
MVRSALPGEKDHDISLPKSQRFSATGPGRGGGVIVSRSPTQATWYGLCRLVISSAKY